MAVNTGRPQLYGTQCVVIEGRVEPRPLSEPDTVDERRAAMGLEPLARYLARAHEADARSLEP